MPKLNKLSKNLQMLILLSSHIYYLTDWIIVLRAPFKT